MCLMYFFFFYINSKFKPEACKVCHDLIQKTTNFNDVAISFVKRHDYRIHFWYMSKVNPKIY